MESAFRKFIVVIMGSSQSGVTEFINAVSELPPKTLPDPPPSPTLKPVDYGRLTIDPANVIYLYGISEAHPDSAWSFLFDRNDDIGVIALVDSCRPDRFSVSKSLINRTDPDIPYLVFANKQDSKDAWELDAIRVAIGVEYGVPVMRGSARAKTGIRDAVLFIVDMLVNPFIEPEHNDTEPIETIKEVEL